MTNDLISRQAAIDELDKGAWGAEWDKALAQAMLESLPSTQPEPRWIPCSERCSSHYCPCLDATTRTIQGENEMNDLISRQAAIDAAKILLDYYGTNDITKEFADNVAENFMNKLPSADRPQGEWISINEERPSDDEPILASVRWDDYGDYTVAVGYINRFDKWKLYSPTEDELLKGFTVEAWMPLPKPYEGERKDDE